NDLALLTMLLLRILDHILFSKSIGVFPKRPKEDFLCVHIFCALALNKKQIIHLEDSRQEAIFYNLIFIFFPRNGGAGMSGLWMRQFTKNYNLLMYRGGLVSEEEMNIEKIKY
ncbi:hypothetical protein ACJX0J_012778, partial [Zea mays]